MKTIKDTITFEIPSVVPMPKFDLFQKVRVIGRDRIKTGVITGICYDDLNTALLMQSDSVGWHYTVNYAVGQSQERLLQLVTNDPIDYLGEDEIEPTKVEAVA